MAGNRGAKKKRGREFSINNVSSKRLATRKKRKRNEGDRGGSPIGASNFLDLGQGGEGKGRGRNSVTMSPGRTHRTVRALDPSLIKRERGKKGERGERRKVTNTFEMSCSLLLA